jgi:hypothetical protein
MCVLVHNSEIFYLATILLYYYIILSYRTRTCRLGGELNHGYHGVIEASDTSSEATY